MKIGVIGIGLMGSPMAQRLLAAGHEVNVHSRRRESAESVEQQGARWTDNPAQCADRADVVITVLPDADTVRQTVLGPDGVLAAPTPPAVVVDMSTSPPSLARELAEETQKRGSAALDAPVSGGPMGAAAGTLTIMVGGDAEAYRAAAAALEVLGSPVHVGGPGAGQSVKLVNQLLIAGIASGIADAWVLSQRLELDPEVVAAAVAGGLGASPLLSWMWPRLIEGDLSPGFKVTHMIKDLALAVGEGDELGADLAAGRATKERYRWLAETGGGDLGTQALFRHAVRAQTDVTGHSTSPSGPLAASNEEDHPR